MGMYEELANEIINNTAEDIKKANLKVGQYATKTCPVRKGDLKASMQEIKIDNGYGILYPKSYAGIVHENPNSKGWKWLENAYIDNQNEIDDIAGGVK